MPLFGKKKRDVSVIRAEIESLQEELEEMGEVRVAGSHSGAILETLKDVPQKPKLEFQIPERAASTAMFYTLSHELRTPLNGVLGMAQLLREEIDSEKLDTLESCAQHMQSVLHTLVNLSKIQDQWGRLPEHREWINLHDLLEQIKKNVARRALGRRLKIKVEHADNRMRLRGDYDHLIHIIETALLGSLECSDANAGVELNILKISWQLVDGDIKIVIENPLELMTENRGQRVFEVDELTKGESHERIRMELLYWSVSTSLLEHYDGAMVASKMDGPLGVRTVLGFKMESMKASPSNQRPVGGLSMELPGKVPNRLLELPFSLRVLIVEDDPINQELMSLLLERIGQQTEIASDGQEAIDLLADGVEFDLVLMDIDMPVLDGVNATRAIRIGEAGAIVKDVPIAAVTAFNTLSDQSKFRKVGMNYYLSKPVSLKDLRSILLDVNRKAKEVSSA